LDIREEQKKSGVVNGNPALQLDDERQGLAMIGHIIAATAGHAALVWRSELERMANYRAQLLGRPAS